MSGCESQVDEQPVQRPWSRIMLSMLAEQQRDRGQGGRGDGFVQGQTPGFPVPGTAIVPDVGASAFGVWGCPSPAKILAILEGIQKPFL